MRTAHDSRSSVFPPAHAPGFTQGAIAAIRDFTTRKILEQSHTFARSLTEALGPEGEPGLAEILASIGISRADADQIALEGATLLRTIEDRDRKADALHAAAAVAAEQERALYTRLACFARLLRLKLGQSAPALAAFGVPPEQTDAPLSRRRSVRPGPFDAPPPSAK